jgi:hypothetical protein
VRNLPEAPQKLKICRHCHTIYKDLSQKYCGNGCEKKEPFLVDGQPNESIIGREVLMEKTVPLIIRWICTQCKREYSAGTIENRNYICECGSHNDFYPFTTKDCDVFDCRHEKKPHRLPLEAKACDLCGLDQFLFNNTQPKKTLHPSIATSQKCWDGPHEFIFSLHETKKPQDKSKLSCTFTILSNNFQCISYGNSREITLTEIIRKGKGHIPDIVYNQLVGRFNLTDSLFQLQYDADSNSFSLITPLEVQYAELDANYLQKSTVQVSSSHKMDLKESILTQIQAGFFKIHIWVY